MPEPLPETVEALAEYMSLEEPDLDEWVVRLGTSARTIVPECVGLSLTMLQEGLTFTLVSPTLRVRTLDAAQYLDDGPCEVAVGSAEVVLSDTDDLLDEGRWQLFAQTGAAVGVASSLSMPLVRAGKVIGGINLYASSPHAFDGHHHALALALGASAEDAVANADLSFSTRLEAIDPGAGPVARPQRRRHGGRTPRGPLSRGRRRGPDPAPGGRRSERAQRGTIARVPHPDPLAGVTSGM